MLVVCWSCGLTLPNLEYVNSAVYCNGIWFALEEDLHGGRLSMVAGCHQGGLSMVAGCHPGQVVTGADCLGADCLGGSKVLVAGCHPGRVVTRAGCLGADCLGAGCHWGGLSRGAMSLHPFSSFKVSRITVALAGQLKYKSWKRRLYCGLFAASYNLFVSDF